MPEYLVKQQLEHDGGQYVTGATVEMSAKQAEELISLGVLEAEAAAKTPKPSPKLNANETIALVKEAKAVEALDELAKGEERTTVIAAIEARRKELEA